MKRAPRLERLTCTVLVALALAACKTIPEGRSAIDAVDVEGAHQVDAGDVKEKIATEASPKFLGLWSGVVFDYRIFDRYVLERDLARVERFYRARGFYEAHARAGRVEHVSTRHVRITIVVDEGPPVHVEAVRLPGLEGAPPPVQRAARDAALSQVGPGAVFDEEKFDQSEDAVKRALTDRGFAYARVKKSARVDLIRHVADVTYQVTLDEPATFGRVTIDGLGNLPEDIVRRTLDLHEGQTYSTRAIDDAERSLLDLGVFSAVEITPDLPEPPPPDRKVPLHVRLTRAPLHTVTLGGGLELDAIKTDAHLLAAWENRNFLGGLRRLGLKFRPGVVLYPTRIGAFSAPERLIPEERFRAELSQPAFLEARTHGLVRGEFNVYPVLLTTEVPPEGSPVLGYREARGATGVNRTIWKLFGEVTYNIQWNNPFTYVGQQDPTLQNVTISYVDFLTFLDLRDDKVHPRKGLYVGNELQLAGGVLGGNAQDVRVQPDVRAYVPVAKRVTVALRGSTGLLFPTSYGATLDGSPGAGQPPPGIDKAAWAKDTEIVFFRAFFAGGPSSNRGWPLRGIGPHGVAPFFSPSLQAQQIAVHCMPGDPEYDASRCAVPLGGMTLWEAQAELRFPIISMLEGAGFCDSADVTPKQATYRFDARRLHLSCGIGLRYDTPVGPIRLDVAYRVPPLNPTKMDILNGEDGNPGEIVGLPIAIAFGIGEAF